MKRVLLLAVLGFPLLSAIPAQAAEDRLLLGVGAFNFDENDGDRSAEARLEYQSGLRLFDDQFGDRFGGIGPYVSLNVNSDGGVFGGGGVFLDLQPFQNVYLRPFSGLGGYSEGDSSDLGGVFQFEIGAAAAYRFDNDVEAGVEFKHISNAGIHDDNPGANSVMLTVSVPLSGVLGNRPSL